MSGTKVAQRHDDASCPSCGRFVGPQDLCPWCGARAQNRASLRIVRYSAIALAILGLVGIWFAARRADIPVVQVQDISTTMNWAYVRIQGTVPRYPSYDEQSAQLAFWVDDGTGELMIVAYRNESQALIEAGKVPAIGDTVLVEGTLRLKDDFRSIVINVPDKMSVAHPVPRTCKVADIGVGDVYQKVRIQGQIREIRTPYEGLTVLAVRDETAEIDVTHATEPMVLRGQLGPVEVGDSVEVEGAVTLYRGIPQISLDGADSLRLLPEEYPIAPHRQVAGIGRDDIGSLVHVEGTIGEIQSLSGGQKSTLDDGTGRIAVVFWQTVLDHVPDEGLRKGTRLEMRGVVSEYRGELEIVPELPSDLSLLKPAPQPQPIRRVTLAELGSVPEAEKVSVDAQIVRVVPLSGGARFALGENGDAEAFLVFWENLYEACPDREHLVSGAWVSIQGVVKLYHGELEIVPDSPDGVVFVEMGELPQALPATSPAPTRTLMPVASATSSPSPTASLSPPASLTPVTVPSPTASSTPVTVPSPTAIPTPGVPELHTGHVSLTHLGRVVHIEGAISEVTQFSSGVRCLLDDGTGPVVLWVPQGLFSQLPDRTTWIVGSVVQATGLVEAYKDEIEVVPQAASGLGIVSAATPAPAEIVRMADLSLDHVGQRVTVKGTISRVEPFSKGIMYLLDDGSAKVTLLLWQDVLDSMTNVDKLVTGAVVEASGKVQEYQGRLEIVPGMGTDVVLR